MQDAGCRMQDAGCWMQDNSINNIFYGGENVAKATLCKSFGCVPAMCGSAFSRVAIFSPELHPQLR
ncbi:MAG: hypothetical protein M0Q38_12900 [Bacteroidales bacterium]|nr:hypothetical protein [Bacteroidales bacterium]